MRPLLGSLSIVAMLCTALATLTAVVFCLGMGANAKPADIRALKLWMLGLTLLGIAGITGGILLLRADRLGWALGVSFAPALLMAAILAFELLR